MSEGRLIAGKYRLRTRLGQGAMGVVWAATNEVTERPVAVKLVSKADTEDGQFFRSRMLREARACGRIVHKNVVEIFDADQTPDGEPFLVMPLLEGETLSALLKRNGPLPPARALSIARDIAKGLAAAHAAGITHRDLKPGNIFLVESDDEGGEPIPKILDFGISKIAPGLSPAETDTGFAVGSPFYMSPEQTRAEPNLDHRSDLWTFGVVLWEMLTCTMPFMGDNVYVVASRIMSGPIPSLHERAPHLEPWIGELIARCLVRDVRGRIGSADEIVQILRSGGASLPTPPMMVAKKKLPLSSTVLLLAIAAGLLLGAVAIAGIVSIRARTEPGPDPSAAAAIPVAAIESAPLPVAAAAPPPVVSSPTPALPPPLPPATPAPPSPRPPAKRAPAHTKPAKSSGLPFDDPG